jgi:ribosomal protein S14
MKKILIKDKKLRINIKKKELFFFILQSIGNNSNFSNLIKWKTIHKIEKLNFNTSKSMLTNRCVETINRKRHNKLTFYSRQLFLKLIRSGKIFGFQKTSW